MHDGAERVYAPGVGIVPPDTPPPPGVRCLRVLLINPSKYDDDGYVMRYLRGVLPSNTLAAFVALTQEVAGRRALGEIEIETVVLDEHVHRIEPQRLARKHLRSGVRAVVALCGVQTNQFPRAADLARGFRAAGFPVMIGGFHVSGAVAECGGVLPPDCRALTEDGVTLVKGEAEDAWEGLLRDALHGALAGFYDIVDRPDLRDAVVPVVEPRLMKRFAYPNMGTIDAGRGCPYRCSFCTIITVQGNTMRHRSAEKIRDRIRDNVALHIDYYFFTDDNFARNPAWEEIFDALIALRRDEGIAIEFMMQVDLLAHRIPGFVRKAADAGCSQVFLGMETLNPANIPSAGKRQNRVEDYRSTLDTWREHGIACHVGYIVGFPFDTPESVRDDVRRLRDEIGADQASFFMLTPLPGSKDHADLVERGEWIEPDFSRFDSFHATTRHARMTEAEWLATFRQAWRDFYTVDGMKAILARSNERTYWGLFKNFAWYRYASEVEGTHPMLSGFFRFKDRTVRRPGLPVDSRLRHLRTRVRECLQWARQVASLYFELQEVWLATRGRPLWQANLDEVRRRYEEVRGRIGESGANAGQALSRRVAGVRAGTEGAVHRAGDAGRALARNLQVGIGSLRGPLTSRTWRLRRFAWRVNLLAIHSTTRADLDAYWRRTWDRLRRGRIYRINPLKLAWNLLRDAKFCAGFNLSMFAGYGK